MWKQRQPAPQIIWSKLHIQKEWNALIKDPDVYTSDHLKILKSQASGGLTTDPQGDLGFLLMSLIQFASNPNVSPEDQRWLLHSSEKIFLKNKIIWKMSETDYLWKDLINAYRKLQMSRPCSKGVTYQNTLQAFLKTIDGTPHFLIPEPVSCELNTQSNIAFAHTQNWLSDLEANLAKFKASETEENRFDVLWSQFLLGKKDRNHFRELLQCKGSSTQKANFRLILLILNEPEHLKLMPEFSSLPDLTHALSLEKLENRLSLTHSTPIHWIETFEYLAAAFCNCKDASCQILLFHLMFGLTESQRETSIRDRLVDLFMRHFSKHGSAMDPTRGFIDKKSTQFAAKNDRARIKTQLFLSVTRMVGEDRLRRLLSRQRQIGINRRKKEMILSEIKTCLLQLRGPLMKTGQLSNYFFPKLDEKTRSEMAALCSTKGHFMTTETRQMILSSKVGADLIHLESVSTGGGSIAEVYKGTLKTGKTVAIKVVLPDMKEIIHEDLAMIRAFGPMSKLIFPTLDFRKTYSLLEQTFLHETNLLLETQNAHKISDLLKSDPDIHIPHYYHEYASNDIAVMDFEEGLSLEEFQKLASQEQKNLTSKALVRFFLTSVKNRQFSTDFHSGNFLFRENKLICLDFGSWQTWDEQNLKAWLGIAEAYITNNFDTFLHALGSVGMISSLASKKELNEIFKRLVTTQDGYWNKDTWGPIRGDLVDLESLSLFEVNTSSRSIRANPEFIFSLRAYIGLLTLISRLGGEAAWKQVFAEHMELADRCDL